jgi:hypothetical protein
MKPLTIEQLDERATLEFAGESANAETFQVVELCAFAEWYWLKGSGRDLGRLQSSGRFREFEERLRSGVEGWISRSGAGRGFIRVRRALTHVMEPKSALMTAVQDGNSRYGTASDRGWGFHALFTGLANSGARMRFRSGDHVLSADGTSGLPGARLRQSAAGEGFLVSVRVPRTRG